MYGRVRITVVRTERSRHYAISGLVTSDAAEMRRESLERKETGRRRTGSWMGESSPSGLISHAHLHSFKSLYIPFPFLSGSRQLCTVSLQL